MMGGSYSEPVDNRIARLENMELENAVNAKSTTADHYMELLACYLHENDLCNAKYLWQRIPAAVKSSCSELQSIWNVGQKMWVRDFPGTFEALKHSWPTHVSDIMLQLREKLRARVMLLVATAYTSLSLDWFSQLLGMAPAEATQEARSANWEVDAEQNIVRPCKPECNKLSFVFCEEDLKKLTDFVSFLEN